MFITSRIGELLLPPVPHTKIILKRGDLKVMTCMALDFHYFNANPVAMTHCALPKNVKDRLEM